MLLLASEAYRTAGRETASAGGSVAAGIPVPARLNAVPRPGAPQSELRIGHVAVARHTPDYHALRRGRNMVLGGQFRQPHQSEFCARTRGFTYGARTAFDFRRLPGPLCAAGQRADHQPRARPSRNRSTNNRGESGASAGLRRRSC